MGNCIYNSNTSNSNMIIIDEPSVSSETINYSKVTKQNSPYSVIQSSNSSTTASTAVSTTLSSFHRKGPIIVKLQRKKLCNN